MEAAPYGLHAALQAVPTTVFSAHDAGHVPPLMAGGRPAQTAWSEAVTGGQLQL
jgi:hypothetical protein